MSSKNGDRSRYHRVRKQRIARRIRDRAMMETLGIHAKPAGVASSKTKTKIV